MADSMEFSCMFSEEMGVLDCGKVKIAATGIQFKNEMTGKLVSIVASDIEAVNWQRLGNKAGIKISVNDGEKYRYGGFKDSDLETVKDFVFKYWNIEVTEDELVIKGWNFGECRVEGKYAEFTMDNKPVFDIPLTSVSNCVANKNEAVLEFHQNEEASTSLMEMRFHMPPNPDDEEYDPVEEFRAAVLQYAGIESEAGQPIALLPQILCTTPRGRYDIKIFPSHISLHGKTYDYKIPIKTIMRLFLVPHKDGRHVYFVISVNPPIRQGQTRYHFLVLEFLKDEEMELELCLTEEQLTEHYKGSLKKDMEGPLYELMSKLFRVIVGMKITVPATFIGASGTPAISCAHKQAAGFFYPLEKGFLYIHKPPMYIRFEEIASVHFARSDVSTRSFDFEVELKCGQVLLFNSVEKDEYNKLYDFVQSKPVRIRNAKRIEANYAEDSFAGSDDDIDPYKATVKAEGKERGGDDEFSSSDDDDYDLDQDLAKRRKEREERSSEGSASEPDEEYDSEGVSESDVPAESEPEEESAPKKMKKQKEAPAKKEKPDKLAKPVKEKTKDNKKAKKDPNAPKRNLTAYFLWLNDNRSSIKQDGDSVTDVSKRAGELWKAMNSDQKKPFEEAAAKDKARYEEQMKEYKKNGGGVDIAGSSTPKTTKETPQKSGGPSSASKSAVKSKEFISDSDGSD